MKILRRGSLFHGLFPRSQIIPESVRRKQEVRAGGRRQLWQDTLMTKVTQKRKRFMGLWLQRVSVHGGGGKAWRPEQLKGSVSNGRQWTLWDSRRLLKPQSSPPITHLLQQKTCLLVLPRKFHQLRTKHSNMRWGREFSHSNQHEERLDWRSLTRRFSTPWHRVNGHAHSHVSPEPAEREALRVDLGSQNSKTLW